MTHSRILLTLCSLACSFAMVIPASAATTSSTDGPTMTPARNREIASSTKDDSSIFVPFLKRFITLPKGWTAEINKEEESAVFSKKGEDGAVAASFTVNIFPAKECTPSSIKKDRGATSPVKTAKALGAQGLGYTWLEGETRQYCFIPIGRTLTTLTSIVSTDKATIKVLEAKVFSQLLRSDRPGRRR